MRRHIRRLAAVAAVGLSVAACAKQPVPPTAADNVRPQRKDWEPAPVPRAMEAHEATYAGPASPRYPILRAPQPLPPGHFR